MFPSACRKTPTIRSRKVLFFVTTSEVKFNQYTAIFNDLGVELRRATVPKDLLVEPQIEPRGTKKDLQIVVAHPLRLLCRYMTARRKVPFFLEDTMLEIDAFSNPGCSAGLPGADTKSWWYNLGAEGVLGLLNGSSKRSAKFRCLIAGYLGQKRSLYKMAELHGEISTEVRTSDAAEQDVPRSNPYFFHSIFVPKGVDKTLGEMDGDDFSRHDYRRRCAQKFVEAMLSIRVMARDV